MNIIISTHIDFRAQEISHSGQKRIFLIGYSVLGPWQNDQNFTQYSRSFGFMAILLPWVTYESLPNPFESIAYSFEDSNVQGYSLRRFTFREIDVRVIFSGQSVKNTKFVKKNPFVFRALNQNSDSYKSCLWMLATFCMSQNVDLEP